MTKRHALFACPALPGSIVAVLPAFITDLHPLLQLPIIVCISMSFCLISLAGLASSVDRFSRTLSLLGGFGLAGIAFLMASYWQRKSIYLNQLYADDGSTLAVIDAAFGSTGTVAVTKDKGLP